MTNLLESNLHIGWLVLAYNSKLNSVSIYFFLGENFY